MAKSKRNKIVHLTQVKKKGKDHKEDLMKTVEQHVTSYKRVFIFDFEQTSSDKILQLRIRVKDIGRVFVGRNSLISVTLKAIGSRTNRDYEDLLSQISGHKGLLFTNMKPNKLVELLDKEQPEFLKKLLGHAQLSEGDNLSENKGDSDSEMKELGDNEAVEADDDEVVGVKTKPKDGKKKKKEKEIKKKKEKKSEGKKSKIGGKFKVNFVKI